MPNRSNETLSPSVTAVGLSVALVILFILCALAQLVRRLQSRGRAGP